MNKKNLILDYIITFIVSFAILISVFFINDNLAKKEARDTLTYYGNEISSTYRTEDDKDQIRTIYSKVKDLRISIYSLEGNEILEINHEDREGAIEDRKEELENNASSFYYKDSKTLNCKVLYYVIKRDDCYIRLGIPNGVIINTGTQILIYGSLILVVVDGIYFFIRYLSWKKDMKSIKKSLSSIQESLGMKEEGNEEDGIALINKTIQKTDNVLKSQLSLLHKENLKLEYILDTMEEGLIVIDDVGKVILVNKYALNVSRGKKEEILNKDYTYLLFGEPFKEKMKEAKEKGSSFLDVEVGSKTYYFLISSISLKWINDGKEKGYGVAILDVTQERNNEKLKREFFQNASHELKTPLTTIIGYSELLFNNIISDEKEIEQAESVICKEGKRMQSILNDMFALASLESHLYEAKKETVDVKQIVEESVSSLTFSASKRNVSILTDLEDVSIEGNPLDIEKLVNNLLSNAVRYNKENGTIKLTLRKDFFSCEDTGIGIDEKDLNRIFERFYRVDKGRSREDGGTGLGLAIVKHICLNDGYRIEVRSKIAEGSTFIIHFKG